MGYFGTFIFRDGQWQQRSGAGPELVVDVHDSDIATIDYRPAPPGRGRFYLGAQPRDFFADPEASRPVDVPAEVDAFVGWAERTLGRAPQAAQLRPLVAEEGSGPAEDHGTDEGRDEGRDDGRDEGVEDTVVRLLDLLGLPVPEELAEVG